MSFVWESSYILFSSANGEGSYFCCCIVGLICSIYLGGSTYLGGSSSMIALTKGRILETLTGILLLLEFYDFY